MRDIEAVKLHNDMMDEQYAEEINKSLSATYCITERNLFNLETGIKFSDDGHFDTVVSVDDITSENCVFDGESSVTTCVLNFSCFLEPGGEYIIGGYGQEEDLCSVSTLYQVLSKCGSFYYNNSKIENRGLYGNSALFTPGIIFHGSKDVTVNVLTCSIPNFTDYRTFGNNKYRSEERLKQINLITLEKRIDFMLMCMLYMHQTDLILGAWGCNTYGQDATDVALIFNHLLSSKYDCKFKSITFAIPMDKPEGKNNYNAFINALGIDMRGKYGSCFYPKYEVEFCDKSKKGRKTRTLKILAMSEQEAKRIAIDALNKINIGTRWEGTYNNTDIVKITNVYNNEYISAEDIDKMSSKEISEFVK